MNIRDIILDPNGPMPAPVPVESIDPDVVELDGNGRAWFAELAEARAVEADAKERIEVARRNLQAILADRTTATVGGRQVVTWKDVPRTSLDQSAVRELLTDEQYEACLKRSSSRTFRVVE